jgi:hypothetical protein
MLAISAGTYLGPLVTDNVSSTIRWRWIGWFGAIFNGLLAVVVYFGLKETAFERNAHPVVNGLQSIEPNQELKNEFGTSGINKEKLGEKSTNDMQVSTNIEMQMSTPSCKRSWQRIRLITLAPNARGTGFKQYLSRLFHTLRVFTFPAVWFAGLQWGAQDAWLKFYLTTESDIWSGPPWNYGTGALGNMEMPSLIGAVLGCAYGGWFSDRFVRWMTRRNRGIQEAEMSLWLLLLATILFLTGMLFFGAASANGWSWPVSYVALGFIGFGWGNAGDVAMVYLEDCYPNVVLEGMVGVAVIDNTIGMVFTFSADPWLTADGTWDTYIGCGVLSFLFMAITLPMIYYGKRCRKWTAGRYEQFLVLRDGL